jgi:hypothetical protein
MITDLTWISKIDHRISAGVVFFVLLLLLNRAPKREKFPLRAACVLVLMCAGSWLARFAADEFFSEIHLRGLAYSVRLLMLHVLFLAGCMFCYRAVMVEAVYNGVLALTVFEIAWNGFKTVSSLLLVEHVNTPWSLYSLAGSLISYLVYFSVSIICSAIYKKNVKEPPYHAPVHVMNVLSVIFISCLMVLEYCGQVFTGSSSALFLYYLCALLYSALNFSIILMLAMLDSFRHENRTMHDFISNKMRYYEMSHEGIVTLQTKCHDLKHQIAAIRSEAGKADFEGHLTELEDSINEYSTVIECGNQTVDIVLTEKNILCLPHKVKFSYMIDGSLFNFLTEREIYSLFGNALDNALEAASKVEDPARRMISLKSNSRSGMVVLQVENTYEGERTAEENGLFRTTKSGSGHGFGLRSIEHIAEKHQGSMSVRAENGIFKLSVVMRPE